MSTRKKIRVVTETEHPLESPDYIDPDGCVNDNNSNPQFLSEIDEFVDYDEYSLLDLGCAGGQFVVDVYNKGFVSVGLEGGNETEILSRGAGSHNWQKFKNECLFFADISQPFDILDEDGNTVKFDFITG
ncbi:MAG TPA: hypothetical protein VMW36_10995 [Patescibacteria group bacterium]|nr:hypothetical protein [Patescibacteria group bacterium]